MEIPYLFFVVQDDDGINRQTLEDVEKAVGTAKGDTLYLIVESLGGDPFSAVAIMNILQDRFKKIFSIIPSHAKSAATIMVLGTDEIYMNNRAAIGPLDLPIEHPADGSRISALDVQNTLTNIASLAESIAADRYEFLRRDKKVSKKEAAHLSLECGTRFVEPIVKQIDPFHLQKANRELKIGWYYAYDMLISRMMKENTNQAWRTARSLVNDYPAHEYNIFADEAKNLLRLNIKKLDTLSLWSDFLCEEYNDKAKGKQKKILYGSLNKKDANAKK